MATFRQKLQELVLAAETDGAQRVALDDMATAYLDQFSEWPCATQVPLARVAHVVAAMLLEPNANVRRLRATDSVTMRDSLG